jgi:hypothetical protein
MQINGILISSYSSYQCSMVLHSKISSRSYCSPFYSIRGICLLSVVSYLQHVQSILLDLLLPHPCLRYQLDLRSLDTVGTSSHQHACSYRYHPTLCTLFMLNARYWYSDLLTTNRLLPSFYRLVLLLSNLIQSCTHLIRHTNLDLSMLINLMCHTSAYLRSIRVKFLQVRST